MTSTLTEAEPSPVFVDRTGRRGRRWRGLGWVFGVVFVGVTLSMVSGLLGTQSDAPSFPVPGSANTLPPGQYVNAPLPAPPGKANHSKGAPHSSAATPTDSATATATGTATSTATGTADADGTTTGRTPAGDDPSGSDPTTKPSRSPASTTKPPPTHSTPTPSATIPPTQGTTDPPAAPNPAP
ncbi:hypothetical protein [Streptomyces sp. IBSBF 2435]|uniref:hypothetical protein n=1 Tax=Streptomyces sp. IBSBF 2435 TaxID=2903531 RepID=UPI002FDC0DBA